MEKPSAFTCTMKRMLPWMLLGSCLACSTVQAVAQQTESHKKWKFLIEPYLMFPSMAGEVGVRNLPDVDVKANASDIFSNLQFGAMLYLEAQTDKWAITSDLLLQLITIKGQGKIASDTM
ncbi:MAG TPA: hypothetical protein VK658_08075 [Chryseolinea sp.]|nr:hypothetical protein [Chryseolinea sp.]